MISRFEQARYADALGVNPLEHRDLVIRLLQGGKTGEELLMGAFGTTGGGAHRRFTDREVRRIRAMYATRRITLHEIAVRYGISSRSVWNLIHERTYREVA